MADVWTDFLFFESRDLVARSYRRLHGSKLSASKAAEILANFGQGRGYFRGAAGAEDLVRPLLIYYGVLSLARGLVLFLDASKREASMSPAHGINADDWRNTLTADANSAAKRLRRLPNLSVGFSAGTFAEFIEATRNVERSFTFTGPYPSKIWVERPRDVDLAPPFRVTLKDVLARLPALSDRFERAFEERSSAWCSTVFSRFDSGGTTIVQTDFSIYATRYRGLVDHADVIATLGLEPDAFLFNRTNSNWVNLPMVSARAAYADRAVFEADLPAISLIGDQQFIVPSIDGRHFSKMSLVFITSYILGMLVRYYPSYWLALLNRAEGDFLRPVVQEAVSVIEDQFPKHVLNELENWSN